MSEINIVSEPSSGRLTSLFIYHHDQLIGEYERSTPKNIARKEKEIQNAKDFLLNIYKKHDRPFVVRWDTVNKQKSVRIDGHEVGVIPREYW